MLRFLSINIFMYVVEKSRYFECFNFEMKALLSLGYLLTMEWYTFEKETIDRKKKKHISLDINLSYKFPKLIHKYQHSKLFPRIPTNKINFLIVKFLFQNNKILILMHVFITEKVFNIFSIVNTLNIIFISSCIVFTLIVIK